MGNAGSSTSTKTPFAISDNANEELNRLSFIADRFLSSSDFYDIENLVKQGTCGNYSVFMRKGIENTLMPFVVDLSSGPMEVYYVDPRKAISDFGVRKKICKSLAETMITAISTITACLASIQIVKSRPREAVIAADKQTGGGNNIATVGQWLQTAGFVSQYGRAYEPMDFHIPGGRYLTSDVKFTLTLEKSESVLSYGLFHAVGSNTTMGYSSGSLRVHFLFPVPLPGTQTTVLPMRLVDKAGLTWAAGILIDGTFKSFLEKTDTYYITEMLQRLFQTASGWQAQDAFPETRAEITIADSVFNRMHKSGGNPAEMYRALNSFFYTRVTGYQPYQQGLQTQQQQVYVPGQGVVPVVPSVPGIPGYVPQQPLYGVQQPAYGYQPPPVYRPQQSLQLQGQYAPVLRQQYGPDGQFDIQTNAALSIKRTFDNFRKVLSNQACPAEERALTLFGSGHDANFKNLIRTGICNDPYWKKPTLADIYPWAAFQFLSTETWDTYGDRTRIKFHREWELFIDGLTKLYEGKLTQQKGNYNLDQMRFVNTNQYPICSGNDNHADNNMIYGAINALHKEYDDHNSVIWRIVNDIVVRIKHPETNKDVIRFHPNVIRGGKTSSAYVRERAAAAREQLGKHYLAVETIYASIAKEPKLVKR